MLIQKAAIEDIPKLCELLEQLFSLEFEFTPNKELQEKGLKKIIQTKSLGDIFVAIKDEEIVAMVNILYSYSTALGTPVALLEDMIVDKNHRGEQIATRMIEYIKSHLKENGFKRVTLLTDSDNKSAQKFYEKIGFKRSSMLPYRIEL
jgi:GNAT superfamily N-acetyltransferase